MSRQLSQVPTPDLPAGASPQFGSCTQPAGSLTGGHLNSMTGLKSLLQHPMKGDQRLKSPLDSKDKDRLDLDEDSLGVCSMRNGSGVGNSNSSNGCGGGNGGSFNQFLGPLLWDRTLPADGGLFQLQYMDLEEFLTENGMGSMHNNNSSSSAQIPSQSSQSAVPNQSSQCLPPPSPPCSTSSSPSSSSSPSLIGLEVAQPQNLTGGNDCLHGSQTSMNDSCESPCSSSSSSCPPLLTPTDSGPDGGGMFDMDTSDMSNSPGQPNYDPRRHSFSEEELKPQPMIKKARKIHVPDNMKDEKYWTRRYKNNEAAKRSRDARRLKENQITVRAAYLERENAALRQEVAEIRKELGRCRNILSKYENRLADQ
ncbi:D site albumin promoter binding protein b [Labrus bergylta]|uniref:D site albumin promoter binding protein b n=1 Tax=Labrus bergylta TaxID=56723 RepID=A0A3Q3MN88_9LABR|nr:thyrotroph embryonic factor-like [Labrus bergylta]